MTQQQTSHGSSNRGDGFVSTTNIEWTDKVWNPFVGCRKVSHECDHCYAISSAHRLGDNPNPHINQVYAGLTRKVNGQQNWTGPSANICAIFQVGFPSR
jgi:protein gp37